MSRDCFAGNGDAARAGELLMGQTQKSLDILARHRDLMPRRFIQFRSQPAESGRASLKRVLCNLIARNALGAGDGRGKFSEKIDSDSCCVPAETRQACGTC